MDPAAGRGRHKGRPGPLVGQLPDGTEFSVGTGFSDKQRESPPPIGSTITYRFQELSTGGVPRFPSFVRYASDAGSTRKAPAASAKPTSPPAKQTSVTSESATKAPATKPAGAPAPGGGDKRYFEFVEGSSSKFWEISVDGSDVTVRFGRIGANGQTKTKSFDDEESAEAYADELIDEKTEKGYLEKT